MSKKNKKRFNVVYSTDPDFNFEEENQEERQTLPPNQQLLYVSLDRKNRGGKEVTLIQGFVGSDDDLKALSKHLKSKCGVGGTAKNGEILIQGSFVKKIMEILAHQGYKNKQKGGA
jgi:translation initiation factor 1